MSYTKGPWKPKRSGMGQSIIASDGSSVASTGNSRRAPKEKAANARLIAAAPDLLAACEQALGEMTVALRIIELAGGESEWFAKTIPILKAAMAKAKGETQDSLP